MFGEDDIVRSHKTRANIIFNVILISFVLLLARLWYLQIYKGSEFLRYSLENRLRKEIIKAPRGMIFSRNNQILVHNIPRFDAIVTPQYLTNKKETLSKLAKVLKIPLKRINFILKKNSGQARYRPVTVKKNISRREVAIIETESSKLPGVTVHTFISREYADKEVGGHLFGYISEISQTQLPKYRKRDSYHYRLGDFIGQSGIEEQYDSYLRGDDGHVFMEVDARGRMKRHIPSSNLFTGITNKDAVAGHNIRLTIDRDLQNTAYKSLEEKVGSAVAVDVNSGEILAMVSRPSFDPTMFSRGLTPQYWKSLVENDNNPLRDRSVQEHYSPGSTFKTITAIAALEEKIITADEEVMCKGTFRLGRRVYHDWKRWGHGSTNIYKSLRRSVDVYFYKIAIQLDIDILGKYAKMFGFGKKTGIALPRETSGLIPSREWKKKRFGEDWQLGETLSCVIGQSYVLSTPLQLAMAYASIANGGDLYSPYLIREIFDNNGDVVKTFTPRVVQRAEIDPKTLEAVKKGLYEVVNHRKGTAWWSRGFGIRMAGKTGTSQVRSMTSKELFSNCKEMPYRSRHHAIFVGFAPYDDPKIAVSAVVEHGCSGSAAAAPIVRNIITTYMKKYYPELHKKYAKEDRIRYRQIFLEENRKKEEAKLIKAQAEEKQGVTDER